MRLDMGLVCLTAWELSLIRKCACHAPNFATDINVGRKIPETNVPIQAFGSPLKIPDYLLPHILSLLAPHAPLAFQLIDNTAFLCSANDQQAS